MIRKATFLILAIYILTFLAPTAKASAPDDSPKKQFVALAPLSILRVDRVENPVKPVVFTHGDISWLPELASQAGWEPEHFKKLGEIILRESGGCPNRKGGDKVDKNCNITGHDGSNHRSDTGLLQINGVNYDKTRNQWALLCRTNIACTQEPLFDPVTNLRAGFALFKAAGWDPWTPSTWGQ